MVEPSTTYVSCLLFLILQLYPRWFIINQGHSWWMTKSKSSDAQMNTEIQVVTLCSQLADISLFSWIFCTVIMGKSFLYRFIIFPSCMQFRKLFLWALLVFILVCIQSTRSSMDGLSVFFSLFTSTIAYATPLLIMLIIICYPEIIILLYLTQSTLLKILF